MRIHTESLIHHPRERVYRTYRDRLPDLAAYIPDVQRIDVESREEHDDGVELHNVWISDREIPIYARAFMKPEMLRWDDFARWKDPEHRVYWKIKTRVFSDSVECSGTNTFTEAGDGKTRVTLEGDFQIDLKTIPGVPKIMAGGLEPKVEKFIVSLITPNLEQVNRSLQRYLDEHPA